MTAPPAPGWRETVPRLSPKRAMSARASSAASPASPVAAAPSLGAAAQAMPQRDRGRPGARPAVALHRFHSSPTTPPSAPSTGRSAAGHASLPRQPVARTPSPLSQHPSGFDFTSQPHSPTGAARPHTPRPFSGASSRPATYPLEPYADPAAVCSTSQPDPHRPFKSHQQQPHDSKPKPPSLVHFTADLPSTAEPPTSHGTHTVVPAARHLAESLGSPHRENTPSRSFAPPAVHDRLSPRPQQNVLSHAPSSSSRQLSLDRPNRSSLSHNALTKSKTASLILVQRVQSNGPASCLSDAAPVSPNTAQALQQEVRDSLDWLKAELSSSEANEDSYYSDLPEAALFISSSAALMSAGPATGSVRELLRTESVTSSASWSKRGRGSTPSPSARDNARSASADRASRASTISPSSSSFPAPSSIDSAPTRLRKPKGSVRFAPAAVSWSPTRRQTSPRPKGPLHSDLLSQWLNELAVPTCPGSNLMHIPALQAARPPSPMSNSRHTSLAPVIDPRTSSSAPRIKTPDGSGGQMATVARQPVACPGLERPEALIDPSPATSADRTVGGRCSSTQSAPEVPVEMKFCSDTTATLLSLRSETTFGAMNLNRKPAVFPQAVSGLGRRTSAQATLIRNPPSSLPSVATGWGTGQRVLRHQCSDSALLEPKLKLDLICSSSSADLSTGSGTSVCSSACPSSPTLPPAAGEREASESPIPGWPAQTRRTSEGRKTAPVHPARPSLLMGGPRKRVGVDRIKRLGRLQIDSPSHVPETSDQVDAEDEQMTRALRRKPHQQLTVTASPRLEASFSRPIGSPRTSSMSTPRAPKHSPTSSRSTHTVRSMSLTPHSPALGPSPEDVTAGATSASEGSSPVPPPVPPKSPPQTANPPPPPPGASKHAAGDAPSAARGSSSLLSSVTRRFDLTRRQPRARRQTIVRAGPPAQRSVGLVSALWSSVAFMDFTGTENAAPPARTEKHMSGAATPLTPAMSPSTWHWSQRLSPVPAPPSVRAQPMSPRLCPPDAASHGTAASSSLIARTASAVDIASTNALSPLRRTPSSRTPHVSVPVGSLPN